MKIDFVQFITIYIMIGFSTYLREFITINKKYNSSKKNPKKVRKPKPSAKTVFGVTTIMAVLLFILNITVIKWTDWLIILLALVFGWFGQEIAVVLIKDPYIILEFIPGCKAWAESLRKNAKEKDKSENKK